MSTARKNPVSEHRARKKLQGIIRMEMQVHKQDAALLRAVAGALSDPARAEAARSLLHDHFAPKPKQNFKAFLASAPLDDIDLNRPADTGRSLDL